MDGSRDPGSGLFNRSELPQSYGTERAPLAPIAGQDAELQAPRARAGSVPRLAVAAKASRGSSGLIDLDEVARSLEERKAAADSGSATPVVAAAPAAALAATPAGSIPATTVSADSEPLPVAPQQRGLLLASIALLAVVAGLLGYLALA